MINTVLSLIWHPKAGDPWHFANPLESLTWKLALGILLVAVPESIPGLTIPGEDARMTM